MSQQHKHKPIKKEKTTTNSPKLEVKEEPVKLKKSGALHQLPTIQNMLQIPAQERADQANRYFEQVKPFLAQYMQKKQGSRVLQLIFKWGGDKVRRLIHKCALTNWKDLVRSKFSLYVLEKISKEMELPAAIQDAVLLQSSWKGAHILNETALRSDENMKNIKDKFYGLWQKSKEGDIKAQQTLHNLVLKIVDKQYDSFTVSKLIIRLALPSMFEDEKEKVLEYLAGKVNEWIGDDQGIRLFIELINLCDPKRKKTILKVFKGHIKQIAQTNNQTYIAVIKLLTEVDDTVQLNKALLPEVQDLVPSLLTNKHAFSIIFALFSPRNNNFNVLGKYQHHVQFTECKKSEEQRKKQLRSYLYDPLLKFLEGDSLYQVLKHHIFNKIIVGLYKSMQEDNQDKMYNSFISRIAKFFLDDAKDSLKIGAFDNSLCADSSANKIIKGILWLPDEGVDYFCDEFSKLIVQKMDKFLSTKAGFMLLGLIEKGGRDYLLNEVSKHKSGLKDSLVGKHLLTLLKDKRK